MKSFRSLLVRLASLFTRTRSERDLNAELQSHLRLHVEDNLRAGMSPQQARRDALMKLGGLEQTKELYRERRSLPFVETFLQDLRYSCRSLRKDLGFTSVALLTLALGIAVNATMFSMVSAFLLRPPSGRDPGRVAVISSVSPTRSFLPDATPVSPPNYLAWRGENRSFTEMAAMDAFRTVNLASQGSSAEVARLSETVQPESLSAAAVSPNYFNVLGVAPLLGRVFAAAEDQPGRDHVVILSHRLWERRFASDPSLIGSTIRINRENYSVIGVMPATFQLLGFAPQLWTPLVLDATDQTDPARKNRSLYLFARLKPDASIQQTRTEFSALARRAQDAFPETEKGWGAQVRALPDFLVYSFAIRGALTVMMTAVGFVLVIACANVAGLLLARGAGRRRELTIRVAIGAGRLRIVRQLLTEGLVISLLGGVLGLLLAYWGVHFLRASLVFNEAISVVQVSLDWNVLLFALFVSLTCALLCGLVPAVSAARVDVNSGLKDQGRSASPGRSQGRLRTILVTAETAFALFLLIGTGLLVHGLLLLRQQNLGFQVDHLLTAAVNLDAARYRDSAQQVLFVRNVTSRLLQIPGSQSVAAASDLPATGLPSITLRFKGQPDLPANQQLTAFHSVVTPDYFATANIPLLRGRSFTEMDNAAAPPVVIVNQQFVHRLLHDQEPLGRQIRIEGSGAASPIWSEIVGVVANVKTYSAEAREEPAVFEPFLQRPVSSFSLMVRTTSDPNSLAAGLRGSVAQLDAELPLNQVMSMSEVVARQEGGNPVFMRVMSTFALLALILAAIGIYGLIAYFVAQRTHEIGIRMALGAGSPDVFRMVLWQGLKMAAVGAAIGLLMALPLPRLFDGMFSNTINAHEPRIYLIVPAAILAVALFAVYVPARRATRVDPIRALRLD